MLFQILPPLILLLIILPLVHLPLVLFFAFFGAGFLGKRARLKLHFLANDAEAGLVRTPSAFL